MPSVTIEYVILLPILMMQVFLFPFAANWLMNVWVDSRRELALKDVAGHLGSTIQQLYFSLNHATISEGTATYAPGLPKSIEDYHYIANGTLRTVLDPYSNSSKVLELTVRMVSTGNSVKATVVLGPNVVWRDSVFISNSTNACVSAEKNQTGTIFLQFGG